MELIDIVDVLHYDDYYDFWEISNNFIMKRDHFYEEYYKRKFRPS